MQFQIDVKTPDEALKATLELLFQHTGQVFTSIVDIISEKYGIDKIEMFAVIKSHPAFTGMDVHPVIHAILPDNVTVAPTEVPTEATTEVPAIPKKRITIPKKSVVNHAK